jgi:hypothetical protein
MSQATSSLAEQPPPCLPGDPAAVSLSYLAQISSEVYNSNDSGTNSSEGSSSGIVKVGPDRFSIYEHTVSSTNSTSTSTSTTLFVAICGTASPLQHVMNVMPHAYRGLHFVVEQALSTKDFNNNNNTNSNTSSNSETRSRNETNTNPTTQQDAYEAGHVQGWKDPARKIYEEVLKTCSSLRKSKNTNSNNSDSDSDNDIPLEKLQLQSTATATTPSDSATTTTTISTPLNLNEFYDRIVFTGHSRGGLLAYYAGIVCARGIHSNSNSRTATTTPPFRGALGVVGFGIPPPPSPPTELLEMRFCARSFVSVVHHNDPVANGSILVCKGWTPATTLSLGSTPEEQQERARKKKLKLKLQQEARATAARAKAQASSIRGGSGFWGALGNIVQTAVSAVGDSATELATDIEEHHSVEEYRRGVGSGKGVLGTGIGSAAAAETATPVGATSLAGTIISCAEAIEPRMAFVVEKRTPENQWVLIFP